MIFDIKRYSINDGPGIRTTIFVKGCSLRCAWCHNPESISFEREKMYNRTKCVGDQSCVKVCPNKALIFTKGGVVTEDDLCETCGKCAEACPTNAMEIIGRDETVQSLMKEIERELIFMDNSGGGVTISGGEPLMHPHIVIPLLEECGKQGIHRTVDTCGLAKTDVMIQVAKHCDHFLYDLKVMDPMKHKKYTGASNEKILENLRILAASGASINIRIPFIRGVNEDVENIENTAKFVASLDGERKVVNLLPYHNIMAKKYEKLGRKLYLNEFSEPTKEDKENALSIFDRYGIIAKIGGS